MEGTRQKGQEFPDVEPSVTIMALDGVLLTFPVLLKAVGSMASRPDTGCQGILHKAHCLRCHFPLLKYPGGWRELPGCGGIPIVKSVPKDVGTPGLAFPTFAFGSRLDPFPTTPKLSNACGRSQSASCFGQQGSCKHGPLTKIILETLKPPLDAYVHSWV